jgi:hypothetical protein
MRTPRISAVAGSPYALPLLPLLEATFWLLAIYRASVSMWQFSSLWAVRRAPRRAFAAQRRPYHEASPLT